jgi:BirA family biotin operon repressor/biotin-[acetyl-CoA-carboxylase] ligase
LTDFSALPPIWRADTLAARFAGSRFGRPVVALEEVESTNDEAWARARAGAPEGLLVVAERQTRGRGRGGNAWFSPPYVGVWASMLLRPHWPPARVPLLPLAAGLAAARAAESVGARVGLKWPNDLVAVDGSGRKAGGVLVESRQEEGGAWAVVVGVGVNANSVEEDFPPPLRGRATSLARLAGRPVSREDFLVALVGELGAAYERLERAGESQLLDEWRQRAVIFGRPVRVKGGGAEIQGVARDLVDDGSLLVRLDSGVELSVRAGELEVVWQGGDVV